MHRFLTPAISHDPGLHLDVRFGQPLSFATQGIVYLNDVAENQGAFTACAGYHRHYKEWFSGFKEGEEPNLKDVYQFPHEPIAAEAGDLIIWHHWLPHGSSPNLTSTPRVAQYMNMYSLEPELLQPSASVKHVDHTSPQKTASVPCAQRRGHYSYFKKPTKWPLMTSILCVTRLRR